VRALAWRRCCKLKGDMLRTRGDVLAAVLGLGLLSFCRAALLSRNAVNPCTLIPHPTKACQLSSNETAVDYPGMEVPRGRLPILLGESNCTVELTGCKPGLCYSFQDVSYLETPMDAQMYRLCDDNLCQYRGNTSAQPPEYYSVFQDIRAAEGASQSYFSRDGFSFSAEAPTVWLRYSTHTCADYFATRGRAERQLCRMPLPVITEMTVEMAISLPCSCSSSPSCRAAAPDTA